MDRLCEDTRYRQQLQECAKTALDWKLLSNKTILITGASGLLGSYFIDLIMYRNYKYHDNIRLIAVSRDEAEAKIRFQTYWEEMHFQYLKHNVNESFPVEAEADYVIHAASNTHPVLYATDPIGTITANVEGTRKVLDYAIACKAQRVLFLSSVEIYGENRGDVEYFDEEYCGYIDCNTLRAGYAEGKRLGEALCQAYRQAHNVDIVIPRLSRIYGPTMRLSDSKAIAQFIKKGIAEEDIVLKSKGNQLYSYTYVADAVMALLYCLLYGEDGQAYNVSADESDITLKHLAELIATKANTKVVYELPDEVEQAGYSKATKALMKNDKLKQLNWRSMYNIRTGICETMDILKDILCKP